MRRVHLLTAALATCGITLFAVMPVQAVPSLPDAPCEVGKYYKLCVWSGPNYTGRLRVLPYNVDRLELGPVFVIRSYKNWHPSGQIIDVFGTEHRLGEWERNPAVNKKCGIAAKAIASGSS